MAIWYDRDWRRCQHARLQDYIVLYASLNAKPLKHYTENTYMLTISDKIAIHGQVLIFYAETFHSHQALDIGEKMKV